MLAIVYMVEWIVVKGEELAGYAEPTQSNYTEVQYGLIVTECWKQPGDSWYASLLAAGSGIVAMRLTALLKELNSMTALLFESRSK